MKIFILCLFSISLSAQKSINQNWSTKSTNYSSLEYHVVSDSLSEDDNWNNNVDSPFTIIDLMKISSFLPSPISNILQKLTFTWYKKALTDGKTKDEALTIAADKLSEKLEELTESLKN